MGDEAAERTIALYLAPGVYHCSTGPTPARADYLSPLIAWREDGTAPGPVTLSIETSPTDAAVTKTVLLQPHAAQPDSDRTEWVGLAHYKPGQETWCAWKGAAMACGPKPE
jgi:Tannase and feruloyl esterase